MLKLWAKFKLGSPFINPYERPLTV
uniref:Uncharacterized protein n=1 Tax=Arundo donax TaxID=35708 RepID=A0A0A9F324_ARUDO